MGGSTGKIYQNKLLSYSGNQRSVTQGTLIQQKQPRVALKQTAITGAVRGESELPGRLISRQLAVCGLSGNSPGKHHSEGLSLTLLNSLLVQTAFSQGTSVNNNRSGCLIFHLQEAVTELDTGKQRTPSVCWSTSRVMVKARAGLEAGCCIQVSHVVAGAPALCQEY